MKAPTFIPVADHALLVQFADTISDAVTASVQMLDKAINDDAPLGLRETIPAFVNLLVEFDPLVTDHSDMEQAVRARLNAEAAATAKGTLHQVLVCYDGDLAPDMEAVAKATGMSADAVINAHLSGEYKVGMYGFAPAMPICPAFPKTFRCRVKPQRCATFRQAAS